MQFTIMIQKAMQSSRTSTTDVHNYIVEIYMCVCVIVQVCESV